MEIGNGLFCAHRCCPLMLMQYAAGQGTSGGNGAVASIPGGVVRGHEQGPGLVSIIAGPTLPNPSLDSRRRTAHEGDGLSRQKTGK
jgi:hypothetical protein